MTTLEKLTILTVSIAALRLLVGGATVTLAGNTFALGPADVGAIGAVIGPVLAAYTASLHRAFRDDNKNGVDDAEEKR